MVVHLLLALPAAQWQQQTHICRTSAIFTTSRLSPSLLLQTRPSPRHTTAFYGGGRGQQQTEKDITHKHANPQKARVSKEATCVYRQCSNTQIRVTDCWAGCVKPLFLLSCFLYTGPPKVSFTDCLLPCVFSFAQFA